MIEKQAITAEVEKAIKDVKAKYKNTKNPQSNARQAYNLQLKNLQTIKRFVVTRKHKN